MPAPSYCPSQIEFVTAMKEDVVMQVTAFAAFFVLLALIAAAIFRWTKPPVPGREDWRVIWLVLLALVGSVGAFFFLANVSGYYQRYYFPHTELHREGTPDCLEDHTYQMLMQQVERAEKEKKEAEMRAEEAHEETVRTIEKCRVDRWNL